jgi:2-polyprenyl-3-methyl-5-hydroxy-6-metoxy-1,4-benzoquinol methylase
MQEVKVCPICQSAEQKLFLECEDFTVSHEIFQIMECGGCGFRFTSPRPDLEDLGRYYKSEEYVSHSDTKKGLVNKLYHTVRSHTLIKKLQLILKYSKRGTILDFGCGTGAFLDVCKRDGWKVYGIEPDADARSIASAKSGIEASGSKEKFVLVHPNLKVDAISLWHVLEHVPDLDNWFAFVNAHLKDSGKLFVAVPNCDSLDAKKFGKYWAAYDVPRHLWHFTPKDIQALFSKHGYVLIQTLPMVFDSFYVSMLSNKYKTGSTKPLASFFTGLGSNISAIKSGKQYSSQIYVLGRKQES